MECTTMGGRAACIRSRDIGGRRRTTELAEGGTSTAADEFSRFVLRICQFCGSFAFCLWNY